MTRMMLCLLCATILFAHTEPVQAHMNDKCLEAITTHALVIALWVSNIPPEEPLRAEDAPEPVVVAIQNAIRECIERDQQQ